MHASLILITSVLIGQPPAGAWTPADASRTETTAGPAARKDENSRGRARPTPPELVAEALALPPGGSISGRPLDLLTLISLSDRRQQADIIHAYWRLAEAVASYRFCTEQEQQLGRLQARAGEDAELRAARASASAALREAESAVLAAQHDLAVLARLPADSPLPLPADRPHVGPYRTHFAELFSGRPAPDRARLIDRTLPIRCRAIDARASAVQAAEDAFQGALDAQTAGQGRLSAVLACLSEHLRQRRAFIETVCRYNHDIADYALAVAGPQVGGEVLVGMLIQRGRERDSNVQRASATGPATMSGQAIQPDQPKLPTRAVRPPGYRPADPATGSPESEGPRVVPPPSNEPTLAPPRPLTPTLDQNGPTPAPPSKAPARPATHEARKPLAAGSSPLYPALAAAAPGPRAKQLTLALHWDRTLPEGNGRPMGLEECLRGLPPAMDRGPAIAAYWQARQRAAEYQVLAQQAEWLEGLVPLVLQLGSQAAEPMLQLRFARLATEAARLEAQLDLIEAEYELAARMGRAAEPAWPLPNTPPHCGAYLLKLEAQPPALAQSWPMRRLAATIPAMTETAWRHATAVVEADAARAAAMASFPAGDASLEQVLSSIRGQTHQTLAFLRSLSDYNRTIAQYALTVLPPGTPPERLAASLVVKTQE